MSRRPTDGWACRSCETVYLDAKGYPYCPWCYRDLEHEVHPPHIQKKLLKLTRRLRSITNRDGWDCWLCHHKVDPYELGPHRATADHVIPRSWGGSNRLTNLLLAHGSCNEYRSGAKITPFAPFDNRWVADHERREALYDSRPSFERHVRPD